jgi:hypothetical protein
MLSDPLPITRSSGRPPRTIRLPKRYRDELPPAPPIPIPESEPVIEDTTSENTPEDTSETSKIFRTDPDSYGIVREYLHGKPSITPDIHYDITEVSDSPYIDTDSPSVSHTNNSTFISPIQKICQSAASAAQTFFSPFRNASTYRLMTWFYGASNTKSITELNSLVKDVILAPDFQSDDLVRFDGIKEQAVMDSYQESTAEGLSPFAFDDTWIKGTVEIPLPCDGVKQSEADAPKFSVQVCSFITEPTRKDLNWLLRTDQ